MLRTADGRSARRSLSRREAGASVGRPAGERGGRSRDRLKVMTVHHVTGQMVTEGTRWLDAWASG